MRSVLQRIATGPELSKDITRAEAREAMRLILDREANPVQAGVFLIALRMKRETDDETLGILDALLDATTHVAVPVDELVDIADPYDGYNRTLPIATFLPAVLAACGVPAISHGVESLGPKHGVTHRQVLRAAGVAADCSVTEACSRLANADIGWAYVDQRAFCPKLHALTELRELIVKRPTLTTVEGLLRPLHARGATHLYTGYVHKAYPRIYTLLARAAGYDSTLLVRGIEGGVIPSLRQEGKAFRFANNGADEELALPPHEFGFSGGIQPPPISNDLKQTVDEEVAINRTEAARVTADIGLAAIAGEPGPAHDTLVAAAALCLWHLRKYSSLSIAADAVRKTLKSGEAKSRLFA